MSLFHAQKPKSAGKLMIPISEKLEKIVLYTLEKTAQIVGGTLGPGGRQVLIERPEMGMKPIMTKDGVTVIKNVGYDGAAEHLILEAARDAATRTAAEAGDGTTTATILSSSIANETAAAVSNSLKLSPQKIVREMEKLVPYIKEKLNEYVLKVDEENYEEVLRKVATVSANGDDKLAEATLEAFDTVGEEGNITIVELNGPSRYEIEKLNGYTIEQGFEESCRNFANGFINDRSGTMVVADNPIFILYDGVVNDLNGMYDAFNRVNAYLSEKGTQDTRYLFLVAHGFSEGVLGELHLNWNHAQSTIKVFPLLTPQTAILNWRTHFLYDIQAYVGAPVFNPIDRPLANLDPEQLVNSNRATYCEVNRFRSSIVAEEDIEAIELRVEELKMQIETAESEYEQRDLELRIGKLTSGIARLNVYGLSQGETREKRDRAEDAWMSIKSALKSGACPGGGFTLVKLSADLMIQSEKLNTVAERVAAGILGAALLEPVKILYRNHGYVQEEIDEYITSLLKNEEQTFDVDKQEWVDKFDLLDSVPAVFEAIQNSISIASLLGTVGGIIAFARDSEADAKESKYVREFEKASGEV